MATKKEEVYWLSQPDPRRSAMFIGFKLWFGFMTISIAVTFALMGMLPGVMKIPAIGYILWGLYFANYLVLQSRANVVIRSRKKTMTVGEETEYELKKLNRFPGWFFVLGPWVICWVHLLIYLYQNLIGWQVEIFVREWLIFLTVITAVFNISDQRRKHLADEVQNGFYSIACGWLELLLGQLQKRVGNLSGKKNNEPDPDNSKSGE